MLQSDHGALIPKVPLFLFSVHCGTLNSNQSKECKCDMESHRVILTAPYKAPPGIRQVRGTPSKETTPPDAMELSNSLVRIWFSLRMNQPFLCCSEQEWVSLL